MRDGSPAFGVLSGVFRLYEPLSGVLSDPKKGEVREITVLGLRERLKTDFDSAQKLKRDSVV